MTSIKDQQRLLSTMALREIGFWSTDADSPAPPDRPHPTDLVDDAWFAAVSPALLHKLQRYLTRVTFVESHELAYSFCRFPDCAAAQDDPKVMGACTMTDGMYCWPEAYWHYASCHHVKPSEEFLQHMEANYDRMVQIAATHSGLLFWDECEHMAAPMPHAMQEWITKFTTVQVADVEEE